MSKKRNKSPAANANNSLKWESNISIAELNEENWSYSLCFLVENVPEDLETINYINKGILTGLRKRFTLITWEKINQLIGEFGNPKAKKSKEVPLNFEICESAKVHLDKGENLPVQLLARFIKWIMLTNKIEDLKNTVDTNKKTDGKTSKAKKATDKTERAKSSGGKKGAQVAGKRSPEPPSVKQDNKLRKRGDPDPDIQYIDDEPDDGSSRYFIVSGIVDSQLIEALTEVGCVTTSLIKITRDIHISPDKIEKLNDALDKISVTSSKDGESIDSKYDSHVNKLKTFWSNIDVVLNSNKYLLNTPILTLIAKHLMFPIDKDNEELKNKCSMDFFETLAVLKYDLLDLKRQWQNYLIKSKLIPIPVKIMASNATDENTPRESIKEGTPPSNMNVESSNEIAFDKLDMEHYHYLMQDVPIELSSIYMQMSAMLEQVQVTCGEISSNENVNKSELSNELSEETAEMLRSMVDHLYLPKNDLLDLKNHLKISKDDINKTKNQGENVPIHSLDSISLRDSKIDSKNLGQNGIMGHELEMLVASFRNFDLLKSISIDDKVSRKRAARLHELLKYLSNTGLSDIEINYAIKMFILENVNLTGIDENGYIRINNEDGIFQKEIHPVWDDPYMIIDEVTQSIIAEEVNLAKKELITLEKEQASFIQSEVISSSIKSDHFPDGILKSSRLSSRSQSPEMTKSQGRKSSVHFVDSDQEDLQIGLTETHYDIMTMINDDDNDTFQQILLDYLLNVRKRSFSEWCFEEFYEPHVLLQIIQKALYKLPYMDIYNQRRVDGQIVVLHNPFHNDSKLNQQSWNQWLHSNVGFRNYLDFVSDKITDWSRDEEAIYQANMLSKELQTIEPEIKEPEAKGKPTKGNDKAKKGKPGKSRSRSSSRASSADENTKTELSLILPGSLKAQKLEQDKINKAKEEEEMKKDQKRQLSARKKSEKDLVKGLDKSKDAKRPNSKASNKSKSKKTAFDEIGDNLDKDNVIEQDIDNLDNEEFWPFVSYNLGDNLAHFSGNVVHLFPSDGSIIRICKMQKLLDSTSVRVSLITNQSHVFTVHIIDPTFVQNDDIDDYDKILDQFIKSRNICLYGASTCVFDDGVTIVASNNGYSGILSKNNSEIQDEVISQRSVDNNVTGNVVSSPHMSVGDGKEIQNKTYNPESQTKNQMDVVNRPNVILSTPDGVQVKVGYEISEGKDSDYHLLLFMSTNNANCPISINSSEIHMATTTEISRYITSDGRVIAIDNNDTIRVLFADGTIAISNLKSDSSINQEEEIEESKLEKTNVKESPTQKKKTKQPKPLSTEPPVNTLINEIPKPIINNFRKWTITLSNGEIYETEVNLDDILSSKLSNVSNDIRNEEEVMNDENNEAVEVTEIEEMKTYFKNLVMKESLLVSSATDPSSGETLVTRSDGTLLLVSHEAGIFLSEHSDGTRFTKYFVIEKSSNKKDENKENIKPRETELLLIESKNYPSITIDLSNGKIETRLGSMGSLLSDFNGYHVYKHSDGTEIEYRCDGEIIFTSPNNSQMSYLQPDGPCSYVFNASSNVICELLDSEGTEFVVDINGDYSVKINNKTETQIPERTTPEETEQEHETNKFRSSDSAISMSIDNNNQIQKFDQHSPRIFTINPDGSGSELLRYRDIVDILVNAEVDEDYYHYREEIQDSPQIIAHTILHPVDDKKPWKYNYSRKTVLPKGLTCRDMKSFPAKETIEKDGRKFAMGIGRGLEISSNPMKCDQIRKPTKSNQQESWLNPMEFRQFYNYPIIGNDIRNNMASQLVEFNKKILRQRQQYKDLQMSDDRSDEEKILAKEILEKFELMRKNDKQLMNNAMNSMNIYQSSSMEIENQKVKVPKPIIKEIQSPNQRKLNVILEQEKINKEKEIQNKSDLKNKIVPNYFTSIYGKEFISNNAMDLQTLNKSMKLFSMSRDDTGISDVEKGKEGINANESGNISTESVLQSQESSPKISPQLTKHYFPDELSTDKKQRDTNLIIKKKEKKYLYYDSNLFIPNAPKRTPMLSDLCLPKYLYAQRPVTEPNIREAIIEDPVRRKMYTTSLIGGSELSQMYQRQTRGINILPGRVDTGLLREGGNYIFKIKLINTGPESCNFKIKQPPSSSGIWVEFLPGPIAAGLSRKITIHVYAIANHLDTNNSNISLIEQRLLITTQTDQLIVPIVCRVMTGDNYDVIYPPLNNQSNTLPKLSEPISMNIGSTVV